MQTIAEYCFCRYILLGIFLKNGSTGKTKDLKISEEGDDVFVAFPEMAAMTLVKNHYEFLFRQLLNTLVVKVLFNRGIQFLDSRKYDFLVRFESLNKFICVIGTVNGSRLKSFVFGFCLSIKIVAVNYKKDFIYSVKLCNELGCLE